MTTTTFHLMTPATRPGDAVSNDLLGMARWLRARGYPVRAYAGAIDERLAHVVRPLQAYRKYLDRPGDVLIYHHSAGWSAGLKMYLGSANRKVIKYHNVTPAAFLRPYDPQFTRMCVQGRRQTVRLVRAGAEVFLADSEFNAGELVALGAEPSACHAVYPFHEIGRRASHLDERLAARLRGRTNVLFVGRLAPNKGHAHVIRAFAHYHHYLNRRSRLILAGGGHPRVPGYEEELAREVRRQRLTGSVWITGSLSRRRLDTCYAAARVFLCASEHEGFCVPLAEAMYHRLPIVAYGGTAVPHTVGDAGLVWETPAPALLAESIRRADEDPAVRRLVVEAQWARFQERYTEAAIGRRFEQALAPVLAEAVAHA